MIGYEDLIKKADDFDSQFMTNYSKVGVENLQRLYPDLSADQISAPAFQPYM